MPRYLTPAWFAAAGAAASGAGASDPSATAALEQIVIGGPDGDVHYCLAVGNGEVRLEPGPCAAADATFTVDYATAAELFRGDLTPEAALMAGRMKVAGDIGVLLTNQDGLARIGTAFDRLRSETSY